jgi:magnesium-transporting ATPase (P-type)
MDAREVAARLGSDPRQGLSAEEAARRLAATGPNQLRAARPRPRWLTFLAQLTNLIVVLLAAAVVTAILGDLNDTVVILAVVVLNAIISFVQEYRAEQAVTALARMSAPRPASPAPVRPAPSLLSRSFLATCSTWRPATCCRPTPACSRRPTCASTRPP